MTVPAKQGNSLISKKIRSLAINSFSADQPPWSTLPDPAEVIELKDRIDGIAGENGVRGFIVFPVFKTSAGAEKAGPTITFTVWIKDNAQRDGLAWIAADSQADIAQRVGRQVFDVQNCQIWVQATAVGGSTVSGDICEFRIAETTGA